MGPEEGPDKLCQARCYLRRGAVEFYDEYAVEFYEDTYSEGEDRFLLLGLSSQLRLLLVCHCYREKEDVVRIISARKATPAESRHYRRS